VLLLLSCRGLTVPEFPLLLLTVGEYIAARRNLGGFSKADALAGKRAEVSHVGVVGCKQPTYWLHRLVVVVLGWIILAQTGLHAWMLSVLYQHFTTHLHPGVQWGTHVCAC
jgi:hypothetical protein